MKTKMSMMILLVVLLTGSLCSAQETGQQVQEQTQETVLQENTAGQESALQTNEGSQANEGSQVNEGSQEFTSEQTTQPAAVQNGTPAPEPEENFVLIADFPVSLQTPELPTGCEVTALTMLLNYYGLPAGKTMMASEYLPKEEFKTSTGIDGKKYGPDLNKYFIGDPFSNGITCGTGAIMEAARKYLKDQGSLLYPVDLSGSRVEELYSLIDQGYPVLVWVTISMQDRLTAEGWYTDNGEYVDWSSNDHGAVLIGYSENRILEADPLAGIVEYDKAQFEKVYESRGRHCVILR